MASILLSSVWMARNATRFVRNTFLLYYLWLDFSGVYIEHPWFTSRNPCTPCKAKTASLHRCRELRACLPRASHAGPAQKADAPFFGRIHADVFLSYSNGLATRSITAAGHMAALARLRCAWMRWSTLPRSANAGSQKHESQHGRVHMLHENKTQAGPGCEL